MSASGVLVERASELSGRIAIAVAVTVAFVLAGRLTAPPRTKVELPRTPRSPLHPRTPDHPDSLGLG